MKSKYIAMTYAFVLALNLSIINGAWAQGQLELKEIPEETLETLSPSELEVNDSDISGMEVKLVPRRKESSEELAQTTQPNENVLEKISVTGSRIKRINLEGPSPILVIDRKGMEQTGYNSVGDVLRDLSVNSFGSARENSGSSAPGISNVSLRGLGADRTLVLLDGKRVQKDAFTNAVDLNLIPFTSVERIEVLKDSASAIYGSDALGGVVNIITRKDFNGSEISAKQFASEGTGGNQTEVSLTSAYSNSKLNVTAVAYYKNNQEIYAKDRRHSRLNLNRIGSPGTFRILNPEEEVYRKANGDPSPRSLLQAAPDCPKERILDLSQEGGGQICQFNSADHMTTRPSIEQASAVLNANLNLTERIDTFVQVIGTRRNVSWVLAPSPAGKNERFLVSGENAKSYLNKAQRLGKAFEALKNDDHVDIIYRLVELGNRVNEVGTNQYNTLAGLRMDWGETWELEASTGYNYSGRRDRGVNGYARNEDLRTALKSGFNPFAAAGERGDISHLNYKTLATSSSQLTLGEVSVTGEVLEMGSGPLEVAMGVQAHHETFNIDSDKASKRGEIIGNEGSTLSANRNMSSAYMEVFVPVTSDIELSLAGRQDIYSDFGQAFSPKAALRWRLGPQLLLRSSMGRGFKAPNMNVLYQTRSEGYQTFVDAKLCAEKGGSTCSPQQWKVNGGGNSNLKEERSLSANLGVVYQPLDELSIGLDTWYISLDNQVGIDYEDVTKAEEKFGASYLEKFDINIQRDPGTGEISLMTAPLQNLAQTEISGVDLSTEFSAYTLVGRLGLNMQHSHIFSFNQTPFPGLNRENRLGQSGFPPWRNMIAATWSPVPTQLASIAFRTVASHEKFAGKGDIGTYTEIDLQYSYGGSWGGVISAGLRNALGTLPTIDDSDPDAPFISSALYDGNGRVGWVQYKQSF